MPAIVILFVIFMKKSVSPLLAAAFGNYLQNYLNLSTKLLKLIYKIT